VMKIVRQYSDYISGTISRIDRILFKGHLPPEWPDAMERLLIRQRLTLEDVPAQISVSSHEELRRIWPAEGPREQVGRYALKMCAGQEHTHGWTRDLFRGRTACSHSGTTLQDCEFLCRADSS
jgi:hypothetical protein